MATAHLPTDKLRVLVLGDHGVGKTSLVHYICHEDILHSPSWTIGCNVDVKLKERLGMSVQSLFVEFWDVGGVPKYRNARGVFMQQADGVILVHDLSNRKSFANLRHWVLDAREAIGRGGPSLISGPMATASPSRDPPLGSLPVLVVGNKRDLASPQRLANHVHFGGDVMEASASLGQVDMNRVEGFLERVFTHKQQLEAGRSRHFGSLGRRLSGQAFFSRGTLEDTVAEDAGPASPRPTRQLVSSGEEASRAALFATRSPAKTNL